MVSGARSIGKPHGDVSIPSANPRRGRSKIFFGYAKGVGRARAMLRASSRLAAAGRRVLVVGGSALLEHGAQASLPDGVDVLTFARGEVLEIDEVLRREPDLLVLEDLASRNPRGARHRRRYQDVEEILEAGVDVWSTLEVCQIEGLADLVERIACSSVEDRVPDAVFDAADEIAWIDASPDELLERLRRGPRGPGREPLPEKATLVALREIALRRVAERWNPRDLAGALHSSASPMPWPAAERVLVCIGPSPSSASVVRTASRMARSMRASWVVAYVGRMNEVPERDARRISEHLRLAETLGGATAILPGEDVAREIVEFARSQKITKILIGQTGVPGWRSYIRRTLVDRILAASGDIDVYVVRNAEGGKERGQEARTTGGGVRSYLEAAAVLGGATGVAYAFALMGLTEASQVLVYLLGVTAVAAWLGRGPAIYASFGAVLLFNFFFTQPRFTFRVHDSGYVFTFLVMLGIGLFVSTLTARIREQSAAASQRERRTEQLYQLSRDLSGTTGPLQIAAAAEARLGALLDGEISILLPDERGEMGLVAAGSSDLACDPALRPVAEWVYEHGRIAGAGTDTHSEAPALCLPLRTHEDVVGVLSVRARDPQLLLLPDRRRLVETFAAQVALALARERLTEEVHRTIAQAENERLRSAVLSSVSHDFRTPLSVITGASSSLLDARERIVAEEREGLLRTIYEEADRLSRLVDNLLQMTRLESGQLEPGREWNIVEDLVGSALTRLTRHLSAHEVATDIPLEMPMIRVDGVLIELVLVNLLDNAVKYAPAGTRIEILARAGDGEIQIVVADRGPGLTQEERERAFEKFYRGPSRRRDGSRGAGLGLAICAAIARLHGGRIDVECRGGGGSCFALQLPVEDQPPALDGMPAAADGGEVGCS